MDVIAVDVGTTSVRLAIIEFGGEQANEAVVLASCEESISHHQDGKRFEQSSREIWQAICNCSKRCLKSASLKPDSIKSIAFSATCSLVVVPEGPPAPENDVIMWMDHRAIQEARSITSSGSKVLEQFGGVCSPEFSLSKIIWLKNNDSQRFEQAAGLFELPDWLVYRCLGGKPELCPRSLCSVACKWGYSPISSSHCSILESLGEKARKKFGRRIFSPGTVSGLLSQEAAVDLGLYPGPMNKENAKPLMIAVGTSLIDAHSGMLAMLSVPLKQYDIDLKIESTFCSLAGTSTCHMLLSRDQNFTRGIWGPYKDVVLKGLYLLEAGQSLTGKLIEICIGSHPEGKAKLLAGRRIYDVIRELNEHIATTSAETELHVLPSYHGNRSPLANPRLKGGIYGLTSEGDKSLAEHYLATVESLCYETRFIVETLGARLDTVLVSGGLMKNPIFMQTLADVLDCRVVKMSLQDVDFMVMGSGLVARQAALNLARGSLGDEPLTESGIADLQYGQLSVGIYHQQTRKRSYHEKKYLCYKKFTEFAQQIDEINK